MPLKVYYLDDEIELLEIFKDMFESEDIEITLFSNPQTAIEAINSSPPDLLVLDYRLPNITGDQIAQTLDPKIPKVLITGDLSVQCVSHFHAIFEKPLVTSEIEAFLRQFKK